jgi:hypothetical protein
MSDIVKRLRYEANTDGFDFHGDLHGQAADHIEHLEAQLAAADALAYEAWACCDTFTSTEHVKLGRALSAYREVRK